ncbi:MAG: hypothetical protein RSC10_03515 [Longicatena sp.]
MRDTHTSKSISFLMELIFVLFFFIISSAICVYVLEQAKVKNDTATSIRNTLFYAQNIIENQEGKSEHAYLAQDSFYINEQGKPTNEKTKYEVEIQRKANENLPNKETCTFIVKKDQTRLFALDFLFTKDGEEHA